MSDPTQRQKKDQWFHGEYGFQGTHTIAYHKDALGWIPAGQKFIPAADTLRTITLERLALPQTANYLMAQIPIGGSSSDFYTVEARRFAGYDVRLPAEAVILHRVNTTRSAPAYVVDPDGNGNPDDASAQWLPGETFSDAVNGVTVAVQSATATGYIIGVALRSTAMGVTSVSSGGTSAGGESMTITGSAFAAGATVRFGGTLSPSVTVVNATTIVATTPPHAVGAVDVVVANPTGPSFTVIGGYAYTSTLPSLTLSPSSDVYRVLPA